MSTDWKFPTQTNVHAARLLKPPTTSCNPAPPLMTWDARHGPVRWRPTGSFGDQLRHCGGLRTSPYTPDWKSSMAGNAEEEGKEEEFPYPFPPCTQILPSSRGWLVAGCLTSQQHASVSQGQICSDLLTCCHTEMEVADQTFYLNSKYCHQANLTLQRQVPG